MLKQKLGVAALAALMVTGAMWASHSKVDEASDAAIRKILQANYDKMAEDAKNPTLWKGDAKIKQIGSAFNTIDALKVENNRAMAEVIYVVSMSITDKKGQAHEIVSLNKKHDVWLQDGAEWKLNDSKIVWETGSMDGQKYAKKTSGMK